MAGLASLPRPEALRATLPDIGPAWAPSPIRATQKSQAPRSAWLDLSGCGGPLRTLVVGRAGAVGRQHSNSCGCLSAENIIHGVRSVADQPEQSVKVVDRVPRRRRSGVQRLLVALDMNFHNLCCARRLDILGGVADEPRPVGAH